MSSDVASDAAHAPISGAVFAGLFQAIDGLRNRRAVIAMVGCTFAGVIVAGLLLAMAGTLGFLAGLLAMLVWIVAIGTGVNAAGLLQMDHARGISPRSTVDALVHGLMCIPKLIVLALAFFAVEVAVFLVIALFLFICKIPFLGPILFVIVFPVSVVLAGLTIAGVFIGVVLSLPAIWQGAGITRALAQTFAIVRSRLLEAVLLLLFVGFLCMAVAMIVFGVITLGLLPTLGMSVSIGGFGVDSIRAMSQGYGGGGHAVAGAIGGALLWALAASLVAQVYLLGLAMVYLRVTEGLDLTAAETALRATLDEARRRATELGDKARQAAQPASPAAGSVPAAGSAPDIDLPIDPPVMAPTAPAAAAPTPSYASPPVWTPPPLPATPPITAMPPAAPPLPPVTTCPNCLSAVASEDLFCGVCGQRLK